MKLTTDELQSAVQRNCHIVDARHGADFGMCTYLLKMREYFRWEQGIDVGAPIPKEAVGDWLQEREALWESLAEASFDDLPLAGRQLDPFDADGANGLLAEQGLVYSAGLVNGGKPNFFLAELVHEQEQDGFHIHVSGRELARCLNAPAAMQQGDHIFVRREALQRLLWERLDTWRWSRPDNALGRAFACYDFDAELERSLRHMTEQELQTALAHEVGECRAGRLLGDDWNALLMDWSFTPAELLARGVRDNLADCFSTLPDVVEKERQCSLHFLVGNLGNMRKQLFPALMSVYEDWCRDGRWTRFRELADRGVEHWLSAAEQLLTLHREHGAEGAASAAESLEHMAL